MANRRQALREQKTARSATAVPKFRIRRSEVLSAQPKSQQPPWLPSTDGDAYALGILLTFFAVSLFSVLAWRSHQVFYVPSGPTSRRSTRSIDQTESTASPPDLTWGSMLTSGL